MEIDKSYKLSFYARKVNSVTPADLIQIMINSYGVDLSSINTTWTYFSLDFINDGINKLTILVRNSPISDLNKFQIAMVSIIENDSSCYNKSTKLLQTIKKYTNQ